MDDLQRLKNLDPQEVFKKTYISPRVLKALAEGDFAKLGTRTKALGFVTILERELGLDLSALREQIDSHFGHQQSELSAPSLKLEGDEEREQKNVAGVLGAALVLAGVGIGAWYFFVGSRPAPQPQQPQKSFLAADAEAEAGAAGQQAESGDRQKSESATPAVAKSESHKKEDSNATAPQQAAAEADQNDTLQDEPALEPKPTLTIIPDRKLWIGIIYLDNREKKAYVTSRPIEINTSRDQLIVTGHGLLSIDEDGELKEYKERRKLHFIYRAGRLEPIDPREFRRYNRGKSW